MERREERATEACCGKWKQVRIPFESRDNLILSQMQQHFFKTPGVVSLGVFGLKSLQSPCQALHRPVVQTDRYCQELAPSVPRLGSRSVLTDLGIPDQKLISLGFYSTSFVQHSLGEASPPQSRYSRLLGKVWV